MGQRLNIEILNDGEVLANSYYHWSGYTTSAIALTKHILENMDKVRQENELLYAIRLLETTGARLTGDEILCAKKDFPAEEFESAVSRNDGLIGISEKTIEDTRFWEEARVSIDLFNEHIIFDAISVYPKEEFIEYWSEEEYNKLAPAEMNLLDPVPFSEFDKLAIYIINLVKNKVYNLKIENSNDSSVIGFIE